MLAEVKVPGITPPLNDENGVLFAINPADAQNWLDNFEYDSSHTIDTEASNHLAEAYLNYAPQSDRLSVLEVGCGTGNLTLGLSNHERVDILVACDISKKMLTITRDKIKNVSSNTALVCADINDRSLFVEGYFDAAFGNSLLHHIFDYKEFLSSIKHTLKPGGVIVFSEPCQQGKSLLSFLCAAILEIDKRASQPAFSLWERGQIQCLIDINRREAEVRHDQSLKLQWEDKHCFDTKDLEETAAELGFSKFESFNTGRIIDGLEDELFRHLKLVGVEQSLVPFRDLFSAFQKEYVNLCEPYIQTPHQMLVFTK